jgi:hypothetical protein
LEKKQELDEIAQKGAKIQEVDIEPIVSRWDALCHDEKQYLKQIYNTNCATLALIESR